MTPARVHVKNKAQANRLQRNLAGQGRTAKQTKDLTSEIMAAMQSSAGLALDLAGVTGRARQAALLSPEFNRHCLKVSRELARKM